MSSVQTSHTTTEGLVSDCVSQSTDRPPHTLHSWGLLKAKPTTRHWVLCCSDVNTKHQGTRRKKHGTIKGFRNISLKMYVYEQPDRFQNAHYKGSQLPEYTVEEQSEHFNKEEIL